VHPGFEPTSNRHEALRQLMDDDGLSSGLLYRAEVPASRPDPVKTTDLETLEKRFRVA
jgi:2-oxoglutarate ferredoxin oxidoreductase subunit beta